MSKIPEHITPLHESLYSTILEIANSSSVIEEDDLNKIFPDKCDHSHTFKKEIATSSSNFTQITDEDSDLSLTAKSETGESFEQRYNSLRASDTDSDSGWVVVSPSKSLMMQRRPSYLNSYLWEQEESNPSHNKTLTLSEEELLAETKSTTGETKPSTKTALSPIEERLPSRINPSIEQLPTYVGRYLWQEVDSKANSSSSEIQHLREECTLFQMKSTTKELPTYAGRYLWQETEAEAQPLVARSENPKEKPMSQITPRDQHLPLYVERALFQKTGLKCRSTPNKIQPLREEQMSSQIKPSTPQLSTNVNQYLFEVTELNQKPSTNVKLFREDNDLSQAKLKVQHLSLYAKQREEREKHGSPQMKHTSPQLSTNVDRYEIEKTEADPKSSSTVAQLLKKEEKLPEIKPNYHHIPMYVEQWLLEKMKSKLSEEQRSSLIEPTKSHLPTNTNLHLLGKPEPDRVIISPTKTEILRENKKQSQLKPNTQPLPKYLERWPFEKTESRRKPTLESIQRIEEQSSSQIKPTTSEIFTNASRCMFDITLPDRKVLQSVSEPLKVEEKHSETCQKAQHQSQYQERCVFEKTESRLRHTQNGIQEKTEKQRSSQNKPATLQLSTNMIRNEYERPEPYRKVLQTRIESLKEKENLSQKKHTADLERRFTPDKIHLLREEHRSFPVTPITSTSTDQYLFEKPEPTTELFIEADRCIFEKTGPGLKSSPTTVHLMREDGNPFRKKPETQHLSTVINQFLFEETDSTRISSSISAQQIKKNENPSQIKLKTQQLTTYVDRVLLTGTESKRKLQASTPQSLKEEQISFQMKLTTQQASPSADRCAIEKSKSNQTSLTTVVQPLRKEQVPSKMKLSTHVEHCLTEKPESKFDRDLSTREKQNTIKQPTLNIGQCPLEQLKLYQKPLPNNIQLMREKQMLSKIKQLSTDVDQRLFPQTISDRKSYPDKKRPLKSTIQELPLDHVPCLHEKSKSNQKCVSNNKQQLMQEGSSVKSPTDWLPTEINQYLIEQGELELATLLRKFQSGAVEWNSSNILHTCTERCLSEKTKSERSDKPQPMKQEQIPSQRKSVAININRRLLEKTSVQTPSSNITQKISEQQLLSTYADLNVKEKAERKSEPQQQLSRKQPVSSEIELNTKRLFTHIHSSTQMAGVGELAYKKKPKTKHASTYVEQSGWEGIQFKSNPRPVSTQLIRKEHVLHQIKPTAQRQLKSSQNVTQPLVKEQLPSEIKEKYEHLHTCADGFIREKMESVSKDPQVTSQPIMEQQMSCQIKSTIKQPAVEKQCKCKNNEPVSKTLMSEASELTEENMLLHIKSMTHQLSAYVERCLFEKKESAIISTMDKTDSMMKKQEPSQIKQTLQPQPTNVGQYILEKKESEAKPQPETVQPITKTQLSSIFKPIKQTVLTYVNRYIFKKVESETNHLLDQSQPLKEGQVSLIKSITQFLSTNKVVNQKLNSQKELSQNVEEATKSLPIKYPSCFDILLDYDDDDELQIFRNQILDTYKRRLEEIRIYANNDINLRRITYEELASILGRLDRSMAANTEEFEKELMELLNKANASTKKKAKEVGKNQNKRICEQCRNDLEEKVQQDDSNL